MDCRRDLSLALAVGFTFLTAGCGRDAVPQAGTEQGVEERNADRGAETPRGALEKFGGAVRAGDEAGFMASIVTTDAGEPLLKAVFRFLTASREFRGKMVAEYGESGWREFQDDEGMRLPESFAAEGDLAGAKIDESGDQATAAMDGYAQEIALVRKDGRWFVDAAESMQGAQHQDAEQAAAALDKLTMLLRTNLSEIGREGTSAEDLDRKLDREFAAVAEEPQPEGQGGDLRTNAN